MSRSATSMSHPTVGPQAVYTIDQIKVMIAPLLVRYGMASASLFGSYARGEADADSVQEMRRILDTGYDLTSILYFNFDDEQLKPYETSLLNEVIECFYARNPKAKFDGAFFFFDEVLEVPEWGAFFRRMVDTQVATIYVAGSSSKMLSLQLASEFRGRAITRKLFPMSYVCSTGSWVGMGVDVCLLLCRLHLYGNGGLEHIWPQGESTSTNHQ